MPANFCIYHKNCTDGFTAAWVCRNALKNSAITFAAEYDKSAPDVTGCFLYVVDFCYPYETMVELINQSIETTIIDHHKSSEATIKRLKQEFPNKVHILFDTERSGALLTWDWFYNRGEAEYNIDPAVPYISNILVDYVSDRDLWKFELPDSKAINSYINSIDYTFQGWTDLHNELRTGTHNIVNIGTILMRQKQKDVNWIVDEGLLDIVIDDEHIPAVNAPHYMASDIGDHLNEHTDTFCCVFYETEDGMHFSLRSPPHGYDVADIAQKFGGGGHKHAAAFMIPLNSLDISSSEELIRKEV